MILSKEQRAEFERAARPLMEWLGDNTHPHCHVIIDNGRAELSEGTCAFVTGDYIKD